jgi:hypothetical protein
MKVHGGACCSILPGNVQGIGSYLGRRLCSGNHTGSNLAALSWLYHIEHMFVITWQTPAGGAGSVTSNRLIAATVSATLLPLYTTLEIARFV